MGGGDRWLNARFTREVGRDGSPARCYADDDQVDEYLRVDLPLVAAANGILADVLHASGHVDLPFRSVGDAEYVTITIEYVWLRGKLEEAVLFETPGLGASGSGPCGASDRTGRRVVAAYGVAWHAARLARLGVPVDVDRWVATAAARTLFPASDVEFAPSTRDGFDMVWDCRLGPNECRQHLGGRTDFLLDLIRAGISYNDLSLVLLNIGGRLEVQAVPDDYEDAALTAKVRQLDLEKHLEPLHAVVARRAYDAIQTWRSQVPPSDHGVTLRP